MKKTKGNTERFNKPGLRYDSISVRVGQGLQILYIYLWLDLSLVISNCGYAGFGPPVPG